MPTLERILFLLLQKYTIPGKHIDEIGFFYQKGKVIVFPSIKGIVTGTTFNEVKETLRKSGVVNIDVKKFDPNKAEKIRVYSEDLDDTITLAELLKSLAKARSGRVRWKQHEKK